MTYEEFKHLAEHPQHRDVPAIFKLEVLENGRAGGEEAFTLSEIQGEHLLSASFHHNSGEGAYDGSDGWCASDARHGCCCSSGTVLYWHQWSAVWSMRLEQAPAARSAGSVHPAVIRLEERYGAVGVCRQCSRTRSIVPRHRPTDARNASYYAGDVISRQL